LLKPQRGKKRQCKASAKEELEDAGGTPNSTEDEAGRTKKASHRSPSEKRVERNDTVRSAQCPPNAPVQLRSLVSRNIVRKPLRETVWLVRKGEVAYEAEGCVHVKTFGRLLAQKRELRETFGDQLSMRWDAEQTCLRLLARAADPGLG